jgi:hypothetical protein
LIETLYICFYFEIIDLRDYFVEIKAKSGDISKSLLALDYLHYSLFPLHGVKKMNLFTSRRMPISLSHPFAIHQFILPR